MNDPRQGPSQPGSNDARSVDELISAALSEQEEDHYWDAVFAVRRRGSRQVFDRALRLCRSLCAVERQLGADILAQLRVPDHTFRGGSLRALLEMLDQEREPRVLNAILTAFGHLRSIEAIAPAARFVGHTDANVRFGVVFAMLGQEHPLALESLIELTSDNDADVRDWATFGLGTQVEVDTPEIRAALTARLSDEDDDVRCEALVGLARRGDDRVVEPLLLALNSEGVWDLEVEAAELIGDQRLYPALIALRDRWENDDESLERAIRACFPAAPKATDLCSQPAQR